MTERLKWQAFGINVTEHCNLRCTGCSNSSPWLPEKFLNVEEFEKDVRALATAYRAWEMRLLGGEPLMHPRIVEIMQIANDVDASDVVNLVTNGVLLHEAPDAIWPLVDRMYVSLYPGVKYRFDPEKPKALAARHQVDLRLSPTPEFREAFLNTRNKDDALVREIYVKCKTAHEWSCHALSDGRYFKCSPAAIMEGRMAVRGERVPATAADGIKVRGNPNLRRDLEVYLSSLEPLLSCRYCLGSAGKTYGHSQLNGERLKGEIATEHPDPRTLIEPSLLAGPPLIGRNK